MVERPKILIVDDEPFNVDYLEQEMEDLGYATVSASNGQEALDQVAREAPDLILLDVMMPVMDGFTACRILKEDEETRLIPVLIMTALDAIDDRIKGIEAGADDFLTKPVDERELAARIQTTLRLKQTVDRKIGQLSQIRDHFAKFVPEAVKRLVADDPDAPELRAKKEVDVSVLFLDISGYSSLSERLPPETLNALIERYFSAFLDCIHEAGGDINETGGDGFMAVFYNLEEGQHAPVAAATALNLLQSTGTLNQSSDGPPLSIHMGLNSGTALLGSTRFEGARGTRWTFTASGPVTNLAARLADRAPDGQVLVGPETARRLGSDYRLAPVGFEQLKNIADPVEVFRVLAHL
ncbi:MAG: response regulator [Candidatus Latescibacteria bacterium]|nr:response regulator [Candidatus Latescibacterota bacterium]